MARKMGWATGIESHSNPCNRRRNSRFSGSQGVASALFLVLVVMVLLAVGCSREHYLAGGSYIGLMAPYLETYTGCPTHDFSGNGRLAAKALVDNVELIAGKVDLLDSQTTPIVFLSAGAVDEAVAGPELAAVIVTRLAEQILALHPELELYHLDYRVEESPTFWNLTPHEENPRWQRVTFEDLVNGELAPDGIHLRTVGYIERLLTMVVREPKIVCWSEELLW